jgi:hypothetical protein
MSISSTLPSAPQRADRRGPATRPGCRDVTRGETAGLGAGRTSEWAVGSSPTLRNSVDPFGSILLGVSALNGADRHNGVPFVRSVVMSPRVDSRWFCWVHYGVMIPGLPEPHRFST